MGLAVTTGYLAQTAKRSKAAVWFRKNLGIVDAALEEAGLPPHVEPDKRGKVKARDHVDSFPYSFLHYLRRAYALVLLGKKVTPVREGKDPAEDPAVDKASIKFDSHLLCHSDCDGFYAPVDFVEVIFDDRLLGGMLGSSVRLMAELVEVAPAIGIVLTRGQISDAAAKKLANEDDDASDYYRERIVWLTLFENARLSIANKSLIVFN